MLVGPHRRLRNGVDRLVMRWPPHLVVGRSRDLGEEFARQGTAHGEVSVRSQTSLEFYSSGVLGGPAGSAADVLPPPIQQLGEMDGIECRAAVVIGTRVHRRSDERIEVVMRCPAGARHAIRAPAVGGMDLPIS